MGIRIHKDIGFFLNKKDIKKVLVKNYDEILDDLDSIDDDFVQKMMSELNSITEKNHSIGFSYAQFQLNDLLGKKSSFIDFVRSIYNYDTFKGILFRTPELAKESRFDGLIDYYENVDHPVYKFKALKQTLYPDSYYLCVKVPPLSPDALEVFAEENPRKPTLEVGDLVDTNKFHYLMLYSNVKSSHNDRIKVWAYPEPGGEKYFHPYVNIFVYLAAKVSGIIKPEVSWVDFSQHLEPAIVTYWG